MCLGFAFVGMAGWIGLMIGDLRGRGLWVGVGNEAWVLLSLVRLIVASLALVVACHLSSAVMALIEELSWLAAWTAVLVDSTLVGFAFEAVAWVVMSLAAAVDLRLPKDSSRHPLPQFQPPRF